MGIKRFIANADTTITNAYKSNLTIRGTGSNMGASDIMEVFSIYGQESSASSELSRILVNFPVSDIQSARAAGSIPASGSVSFYLRLFNAPHGQTLPKDFTMVVQPLSRSWDEGTGLDMEDYSDSDEANWYYSNSSTSWTTPGGDYLATPSYTASFTLGNENLSVDISNLVEGWVAGTTGSYGVGIRMTSSIESDTKSYYTKKFFTRRSENYLYRPILEARWDQSKKDSRSNFYASSSVVPAVDNTMTLYLYNYVHGQLKNIPAAGTGSIYLKMYTSSSGGTDLTATAITGGYVEAGIYSASFALDTTASYGYDRWFSSGLTTCFHTGSQITIRTFNSADFNPEEHWTTKITNLKPYYTGSEVARFRVFTKKKAFNQNIYTRSNNNVIPDIVDSAYYSIRRTDTAEEVIPFGTGSLEYTKLSYDASGSYFDFDMSILEPEQPYKLQFMYYVNGKYAVQPEEFKFGVR